MNVFFDTNVLASAIATRGLCADLLRESFGIVEFVVSDALLTELERILALKFKMPTTEVQLQLGFLRRTAKLAIPSGARDIALRDKDDIILLSAALHAKSDFFVTGDKEVLALKNLGKMRIVSPRQFWDVLRGT